MKKACRPYLFSSLPSTIKVGRLFSQILHLWPQFCNASLQLCLWSDSQQTDSHSVVPPLPQLLVLLLLLFPPPTMLKLLCPIPPLQHCHSPMPWLPHCSIEALVSRGVGGVEASRHRGGLYANGGCPRHFCVEAVVEASRTASSLTSSLRRVWRRVYVESGIELVEARAQATRDVWRKAPAGDVARGCCGARRLLGGCCAGVYAVLKCIIPLTNPVSKSPKFSKAARCAARVAPHLAPSPTIS